jgi:hypothetical protein
VPLVKTQHLELNEEKTLYTSRGVVILGTVNLGIKRVLLRFCKRVIFKIIGKVGSGGIKDKVQQYIPILSFE